MRIKKRLKLIIAILILSFFTDIGSLALPLQYEDIVTTDENGATTTTKQIAEFDATATVAGSGSGGFSFTSSEGGSANYSNSNLQITFAGKTYDAYCLDPGLAMPEGNMTCKAINRSPQIRSLVEYAGSEGADADTTQLAYRMWASMTGWTQEADEDFNTKEQLAFKETMADYHTIMNGSDKNYEAVREELIDRGVCSASSCNDRESTANKLFGNVNGSTSQSGAEPTQFQQAYEIAYNAVKEGKWGTDKMESNQGGITTEITPNPDGSVTVKMTSKEEISKDELNIDNIGAEMDVKTPWNGKSGEFIMYPPAGKCTGTLDLYYDTKGSYECSTNSKNSQTLYTYVDQASTGVVQSIDVPFNNVTGCSDCCTEGTPGKSVNVNNCCYDGTESEVREPELNSLFCKDEELNLEYFFDKCGATPYEEDPINDFCRLWCTERVHVETPGSTTATSGRYFILNKTSHNTTSPYVLGFKRCRVKVDLETWFSKYQAQVKAQMTTYEEFQKQAAVGKMLEELTMGRETGGTKVTCSAPWHLVNGQVSKCPSGYEVVKIDMGGWEKEDVDVVCDTKTGNYNSSFRVYTVGEIRKYYGIEQIGELDDVNRLFGYEKLYLYLSAAAHPIKQFVVGNGQSLGTRVDVSKGKKILEYEDYDAFMASEARLAYTENLRVSGPCYQSSRCVPRRESKDEEQDLSNAITNRVDVGRSCSITFTGALKDYDKFYMENLKEENPTKQQHEQDRYTDATTRAKQLEKDIDMCTHYFERIDPKQLYSMNPSAQLSYTQTYLDDKADLKTDTIQIPFESSPGCTISMAGTSGDGEIMDPQYADKYTNNQTKKESFLKDLRITTLQYMEKYDRAYYEANYVDDEYTLDKKSTHDGKVKAECSWNEKENTVYTLAQSGALEKETMPTKNFTIHNRQYEVHLSTLEGKYETMWKMSGMGSNGKFDKDFLHAGTSCSANDPVKVGMFTCAVEVEHEVVLTGYCNGQGAHGVTNGISNCEPFKEGFELINFKVVDPSDLFPAFNDPSVTPSYNGEQYAHNWVQDKEGKEVLGAIQSTGQADETYAPKNLSYSFTLAPQDMQEIKDYNESRIGEGGYTDFELTCECPGGPIPHDSVASCNRCRSTFIDQLASGSLGGANENSGWSNERESLGTVRGKNHW